MEEKQKRGFLITWLACVSLFLVLCFFGVTSSMKGTQAKECYIYNGIEYCQDSAPSGFSSTSKPSDYVPGTDSSKPSSSPPSSSSPIYNPPSSSSPSSSGKPSENCAGHPGAGWSCGYYNSVNGGVCYIDCVCTDEKKCGNDDPYEQPPSSSSDPNCVTKHPGLGYSCGYHYSGDKMCYDCTLLEPNFNANSMEEAEEKCNSQNNKECECAYIKENVGGTGAYYCKPLEKVETGCTANGEFSSPQSGKSCSYYYYGESNKVCWYDCKVNECSDGTIAKTDANGNTVCTPLSNDKSACWVCDGNYSWGLEPSNQGCKLTYITSQSACTGTNSPGGGNGGQGGPTDDNDSNSDLPSSSNNSNNSNDNNNNNNNNNNVIDNPQTGEIVVFMIWIIGFVAIGYSVWYYIKSRKES